MTGSETSIQEIELLRQRVAELEEVNAALEARAGSYRELIEHAHDMIWTVDEAGAVTFLNSACQTITGYAGQELAGTGLAAILAAEKRGASADSATRLRHYEIRIEAKNGIPVDLEVSSGPMQRAGAPAGILAIARDITARKLAQECVRRSAENFEYLFTNHPMPMWVVDTESLQFLEVNQAAIEKYGYSRPEFLAISAADLRPPGEAQRFRDFIRDLQPGGHGDAGYWRHVAKNGRILDSEVFWRSLNFAGRDAVLAVIEDITERKLLEEQLRQSQKLQAVGRLAGGVAHEFNNLLTVILGYSQLLLNHLELEHPMHAGLDQIRGSAEKAGVLTRQLMAFSKRQSIKAGVLDLNTLVAGLEKRIAKLVGDRVKVALKLCPELGLVQADSSEIEQVLMNLAGNAGDAMPEGGTLTIETSSAVFSSAEEAAGHRPGGYGMVAVTDTGEGIDTESQSHLFEPFFSTRGKRDGAGLGLAFVYGMIEQHGGFVRVSSELGRGARFEVYLPNMPAGDTVIGEAAGAGGRETILVVQHETGVLKLMVESLRDCGYAVLAAADGMEALGLIKRDVPVDMLLTEAAMPGMSGHELAASLKKLLPDLKVLYLFDPHTDGKLSGDEPSLAKPFSTDTLTQTIRQTLDRARR